MTAGMGMGLRTGKEPEKQLTVAAVGWTTYVEGRWGGRCGHRQATGTNGEDYGVVDA